MTEYLIVVCLIGVAAVAGASFFGATIKGQFVQLGGEMLGAPDTTGIDAATAKKADAVAKNGGSTLGDYGN